MAAQKKLMTKGQVVTHLAGKFEISKKAAASIIDENAGLAIAETKKKGALVFPCHRQVRPVQKKSLVRAEPGHRRNDQDPGEDRC